MKDASPQPSQATDDAASIRARLRLLPAVDALAQQVGPSLRADGLDSVTHETLIAAVRAALDEARERILAGDTSVDAQVLAGAVREHLERRAQPKLRPVINATGVIVNTNLGRAPLGQAALDAIVAVARDYSNLEYDLDAGTRGSRHEHVRYLLREVTGAEDALVVNNNAAAVFVVLSALASGREVVLSRGELVEIGGGFRIPDVLRQSGATLVEVGTTNRTRAADFAAALSERTALLLSVHPSNFRIVGFTESPALRELATLAREHGVPLVHDVGSGSVEDTAPYGLAHEPTPQESLAAGADIVCFSGDKLFGGPQAGIIVGCRALLAQIERHPLMRAVRIDKLTLAALEATLRVHRDGRATDDIPVRQLIALPLDVIRERAERWSATLRGWGIAAATEDGHSTVGGGSLPGETLPTVLCSISLARSPSSPAASEGPQREVGEIAARLRRGDPPVVARVSRDALLLDPRTVFPRQDAALLDALRRALIEPDPIDSQLRSESAGSR